MSLYKKDPNDESKQIPIGRSGTGFYSYSIVPDKEVAVKRPSHVIVNSGDGEYAFSYETTPANGAGESNYVTGSAKVTGSIKLDIQPIAWRRIDKAGVVGDVTFVYRRKG